MDVVITRDRIDLPPGQEVILRHQTWSDYEDILHSRQDKAGIKVYFNTNTQEIRLMSPLPRHGKLSDTLSDLVKVLLKRQGRDWESFDPITLKRSNQKGVEPDACFYIQNRQAILGKERIDLTVDPPPDLALEIDWMASTSPDDYQGIGIPELWIYCQQTLLIYLLDGQQYQESLSSSLFPEFSVRQIIPEYLELAWEVGSSIALRELEQRL